MRELLKQVEEKSLEAEMKVNMSIKDNDDYARRFHKGQERAYKKVEEWIKERIENEQ